jgi:8-oxo-dGTP diphosphatase
VQIGASAVIFDGEEHALLVHHTYGRLNWELPGGHGEAGESGEETALREVLEETSLHVRAERLTGLYYEPEIDMHHFVFACSRLDDAEIPQPDRDEIAECGYWPLDALPRPISDFTIRRIYEAIAAEPVTAIARVPSRQWFD